MRAPRLTSSAACSSTFGHVHRRQPTPHPLNDAAGQGLARAYLVFIEKPVLRAEPHRAHVALYPRGVFEEEGQSRSFLQILPERNRSVSSHDDRTSPPKENGRESWRARVCA